MDKLLKILLEIRPECDFESSKDFIKDGVLDSMDIIMLVSNLEETYAISIEGTEIIPENFNNLDVIKELIQKHGGRL